MATESFSSFGSHQLIFDFVLGHKTGSLCFQPGGRKLFFEDGQLIFANSESPGEHFSDILVQMGALDGETLSELKAALAPGESLGKKLKDLGLANAAQLAEALKQQITCVVEKVLLTPEGQCDSSEGALPARVPKLRIQILALVLRALGAAADRSFLQNLDPSQPISMTERSVAIFEELPLPNTYDPLRDRLQEGFPASCNELSDELGWENNVVESLIYVLQLLGAVHIAKPDPHDAGAELGAGALAAGVALGAGLDELDQTVSSGFDQDNPLDLSFQGEPDAAESDLEDDDNFGSSLPASDSFDDEEPSWDTSAGPQTDVLADALDDTFDEDTDHAPVPEEDNNPFGSDEDAEPEPFHDPFEEEEAQASSFDNEPEESSDPFGEALSPDEAEGLQEHDPENPEDDVLFDGELDDQASLGTTTDENDLFGETVYDDESQEASSEVDDLDKSLESLDEAANSAYDDPDVLDVLDGPADEWDAMDRAAKQLEEEGFGVDGAEGETAFQESFEEDDEEDPFKDDDGVFADGDENDAATVIAPAPRFYSGEFDAEDLKGGIAEEDPFGQETVAVDSATLKMDKPQFGQQVWETPHDDADAQKVQAGFDDDQGQEEDGPGSYIPQPKSRMPLLILGIVVLTGLGFGLWSLQNKSKSSSPQETTQIEADPTPSPSTSESPDSAAEAPAEPAAATSSPVESPADAAVSEPVASEPPAPQAEKSSPAPSQKASSTQSPAAAEPEPEPETSSATMPATSDAPASGTKDVGQFVKDSQARFAAADKKYAVALMVLCEESSAKAFLAENPHDNLYLLPTQVKDRSCLTVCYGLYATRKEAIDARSNLPEGKYPGAWIKNFKGGR